jgi:D-alanyl-D-alanine carboxypeptidase (penicillin-binding protein 5/6)
MNHYLFKILSIIFFIVASCKSIYAFDTEAPYAILVDYNTKKELYEKNADERMVPSSMTKILTLYLAFQHLKSGDITMDSELLVSENAWSTFGSKMFVPLGEKVRVEDLLRGIIIQSGNDACKVIAEGLYGDENTFAEKMNAVAKSIGMENSNFKNSSGMPDDDHYSTARDLSKLGIALIRDFPEYYPYFVEQEFTFNNITQQNRNTLLGKMGVDGIKTGHTDSGGYGVVISAERNGRRLIAVVNGLKNQKQRAEEAMKLINYGFSNFSFIKLHDKGKVIHSAPVWYGSDDNISLVTNENIEVVFPKNPMHKPQISQKVVFDSPIKAPIKKGDKIAELVVIIDEQNYVYPLVADKDIEKGSWFRKVKQNLGYYLSFN